MATLQEYLTDYQSKSARVEAIKGLPDDQFTEEVIAESTALPGQLRDLKGKIEAARNARTEAVKAADDAATFARTPVLPVPHATAVKAAKGGDDETTYGDFNQADEDTEAYKFARRGPFKSLSHLCYAVRAAGDRPGSQRGGDLGAWYAGVAKHDGALKALACKGVPDGEHGSVKAITGLGEFSDSEAAVLIPYEYSAGIWSRMMEEGESIASLISWTPVTGNSLKFRAYNDRSRADGSRWGGMRAYWLAEAEQKPSSKPSFRTVDLKLHKLAALVYSTDEMLEDAPAAQAEIMRSAAGEMAFAVEVALMHGSGVGQPLGFMNSPAKIAVVSNNGANNTISATDIDNMYRRRWRGSGKGYVWLANQDVEGQIAQLRYDVGSTPYSAQWLYVPPGGITERSPARLKGAPLYFTEVNESLGTEGDIVLFDPTQYAGIVKSGGVKQDVSMHIRFDYDETCFRFVLRMDARPMWEAALTRYKGSDTLSPIITLETTRSS